MHNDTELLTLVSNGDEQAFRRLIYLYSERVFFHALTFVKSWTEAEELVQDIFLRVWQKRAKLAQVENWDKYLFVISRNFLINAMQRKAGHLESDEIDKMNSNLRPDDQHDNKELRQLLDKAINHLSEQKRAVFTMVHLEGLSQAEVGLQLGIAARTVRWNLVSAINEIRDFLHRHSIEALYFFFLASFSFFKK